MTVKKTLEAVLSDVHALHKYTSDISKYGKKERWVADVVGDCEDFALVCKQRLKDVDIESDLVLCKTETGGHHLVCSVDGWILDNRYPDVINKDHLNYTWLKIGRDGVWFAVA